MKRYNVFEGYYESRVEEHPLYKELSDSYSKISDTLKDNELKLYFLLDRFIYTNEKNETEFDSGLYSRTYDLTFSKDPDEFFLEYSLRLMSLHTILMGEPLPFAAIGIWKNNFISYSFMRRMSNESDFKLFDLREKWTWLINDMNIIEKNINFRSNLQKALIWYALAELSETRLETFMNFYRCIEMLSTEFHKNTEDKLNLFIKNELHMFDEKKIKSRLRIPLEEKVNSYLKSQCVKFDKIEKIIEFRHKIAHGEDYALEFNLNLINTIDEVQKIISIILNRKIKKWGFKDLKNPSFLKDYVILVWESEHKMVLTDTDDIDCYGFPRKWHLLIGLGQQTNEDELSELIQDRLKSFGIENNKQFCRTLIENFGKIVNY